MGETILQYKWYIFFLIQSVWVDDIFVCLFFFTDLINYLIFTYKKGRRESLKRLSAGRACDRWLARWRRRARDCPRRPATHRAVCRVASRLYNRFIGHEKKSVEAAALYWFSACVCVVYYFVFGGFKCERTN